MYIHLYTQHMYRYVQTHSTYYTNNCQVHKAIIACTCTAGCNFKLTLFVHSPSSTYKWNRQLGDSNSQTSSQRSIQMYIRDTCEFYTLFTWVQNILNVLHVIISHLFFQYSPSYKWPNKIFCKTQVLNFISQIN